MSEANTSVNQSQLLSKLESFSQRKDLPKNDSYQNNIDMDKSIAENVNQTPAKPSQELLKNADWYGIASKIRANNRKLVQKIIDLEASLAEKARKLETQQRRCQSADNLIEQQRQELNNSQQEIGRLERELEKANHEFQNQQIFMESLSQQLRTSQEQIARLERECSLLQDDYHQQKRKLLEVEKQNRELEVRLQRQQHYTLQFKAALDQCLKAPSEQNIEEILENNVALKVKEIHPWSNYQPENGNISVIPNLHKKLLATQPIDVSKYQVQDSPKVKEETPVLEELEEKIGDKREDSQIKTNNLSINQKENKPEKDQENKVNQKQKNININLPFWNGKDSNSGKSVLPSPKYKSNSLFLKISDPQQKKNKKRFLKLPNFLE
jgi:hypothetical protein